MKLMAGNEMEYRRRHEAIWPELSALLKSAGISRYTIFLDPVTGALFGYLESSDPRKMEALAAEAVMKQWWSYMKDIMETNPDHSPVSTYLEEVFHMD
jgi:L-rhamnose mutarotase